MPLRRGAPAVPVALALAGAVMLAGAAPEPPVAAARPVTPSPAEQTKPTASAAAPRPHEEETFEEPLARCLENLTLEEPPRDPCDYWFQGSRASSGVAVA